MDSGGNPYHETIIHGKKIRTFSCLTSSEELVWHRDASNRTVCIESGNGWRFQLDNQLPKTISVGDVISIPANVYHRILPGLDDLVVTITEEEIIMDKEIQELLKLAGIGHSPVEYNTKGEESPFTADTLEDGVEEDFLKPKGGEYMDDESIEENAFNTARDKAIAAGQDSFEFEGETYPVTDVDSSDRERAKTRFAEDEDDLVYDIEDELEGFDSPVTVDGEKVNIRSIEAEGGSPGDYSDAMITYAEFTDGTSLTPDQLEQLDDHPDIRSIIADVLSAKDHMYEENENETDTETDVMIKFENEEAHDLIDELFGALADRGIEGEIILPPRVRGAVEQALQDGGFVDGEDYQFVDPMTEVDLQNGYDQHHSVDGDSYFPDGDTGPAPRRLGPGAARHGDNPLATQSHVTESKSLYERYMTEYKKFSAGE